MVVTRSYQILLPKNDFLPFSHWYYHCNPKKIPTWEGKVVERKQKQFWNQWSNGNNLAACPIGNSEIFSIRIPLVWGGGLLIGGILLKPRQIGLPENFEDLIEMWITSNSCDVNTANAQPFYLFTANVETAAVLWVEIFAENSLFWWKHFSAWIQTECFCPKTTLRDWDCVNCNSQTWMRYKICTSPIIENRFISVRNKALLSRLCLLHF